MWSHHDCWTLVAPERRMGGFRQPEGSLTSKGPAGLQASSEGSRAESSNPTSS